jgi:predicted nucleic acid-binding protein
MVFIDTSYVYALINVNDQWHSSASSLAQRLSTERVRSTTSEFVLTEIADGLSSVGFRKAAAAAIRLFYKDPETQIVPASSDLLRRGLELYESREDKNWGLTDCTSFIVMTDLGISDALSSDIHFRQAGFNPLLIADK